MYNSKAHSDRLLAITDKAIVSGIMPDEDGMTKATKATSAVLSYLTTAKIAKLAGEETMPDSIEAHVVKSLNDYEDSVTLLASAKG